MFTEVSELSARVRDGARLALPPDYSGPSMAMTRALIDRGARRLHLLGLPQLGLQADMLIGAGCVASVETAAVGLGEHGLAPCFGKAVAQGLIQIKDSTCPAIHAGLQAAEKGIPFMPIRGILGSDLVRHRPDWKVMDNPFGENDPILLVPAIRPDVTVFHAPLGDTEGNVWIGVRRELMLAAHASRETLVTVESVSETSLLDDPRLAAGTIAAFYVSGVALAPGGARPVGLPGHYPPDPAELDCYVSMVRGAGDVTRYLERLASTR